MSTRSNSASAEMPRHPGNGPTCECGPRQDRMASSESGSSPGLNVGICLLARKCRTVVPFRRPGGALRSPLGWLRYTRDVTYSIVARDPTTAELGAAGASCMFAVGSLVPWARAGVGAVATQAFGEIGYGPRCLDLLAAGVNPETALANVRAADGLSALRSRWRSSMGLELLHRILAICALIMPVTTSATRFWRAAATLMASDRVWPAMAEAYELSRGPLGARMLSALRSAQAAGGNWRTVE